MGLKAGTALWVLGALGIFPAGRTYAVFFGVFYGLMELIPYLGLVLGAAPPILVALFQGDPLAALWLALLFVALQQLEGHVVAPQVFGHSLRINPPLVRPNPHQASHRRRGRLDRSPPPTRACWPPAVSGSTCS
nr:AI-2E family transporter [Kribbella sp. VKM Ac-2527]